jgi:hypothetical protein
LNLVLIGSCFGAAEYYKDLFDRFTILDMTCSDTEIEDHIKQDTVVVLGGGEDISPAIYNEPKARLNHGRPLPSMRDAFEMQAFKQAQKVGAKCYGICRGAQLLCALSGGKLIQHVSGHGAAHFLRDANGARYLTSSVHHQMMWPFGYVPSDKFELIGWTEENRSSVYVFTDQDIRDSVDVEPEILYFKDTRSLAIQGHPEFMDKSAPFVQYSRELVKKYLMGG